MINELKKYQEITAEKINEIIRRLNALSNIRGSGSIQVSNNPHTGVVISAVVKNTATKMAGIATTIWGKIIECPAYPDPSADPQSEDYTGRSYYTVRLITTEDTAVWAIGQNYYDNDGYPEGTVQSIVAYPTVNDATYICIKDHISNSGNAPDKPLGQLYWSKREEIKIEYALGFENEVRDLRDFAIWIPEGEVVPLVARTVSGETRYYLDMTLPYGGESTTSSLRWNSTDKRMMAVFK